MHAFMHAPSMHANVSLCIRACVSRVCMQCVQSSAMRMHICLYKSVGALGFVPAAAGRWGLPRRQWMAEGVMLDSSSKAILLQAFFSAADTMPLMSSRWAQLIVSIAVSIAMMMITVRLIMIAMRWASSMSVKETPQTIMLYIDYELRWFIHMELMKPLRDSLWMMRQRSGPCARQLWQCIRLAAVPSSTSLTSRPSILLELELGEMQEPEFFDCWIDYGSMQEPEFFDCWIDYGSDGEVATGSLWICVLCGENDYSLKNSVFFCNFCHCQRFMQRL